MTEAPPDRELLRLAQCFGFLNIEQSALFHDALELAMQLIAPFSVVRARTRTRTAIGTRLDPQTTTRLDARIEHDTRSVLNLSNFFNTRKFGATARGLLHAIVGEVAQKQIPLETRSETQ